MFCPGNYSELYQRRFPYDQLDGVLELLDIADNYVLNDVVAIGGVTLHRSYSGGNDITDFLLSEAKRSTSVEVVSGDQLGPYRKGLGVDALEERIREFDKNTDEQVMLEKDSIEKSSMSRAFDKKRAPMFEEVNTLEAQAYMLFADSLHATYVPERLFGFRAIEKYPDILGKSPHFARTKFMEGVKEKLSIIHAGDSPTKVLTPSFLLEALRASETQAGIPSALRDLRHSSSAESYRKLTRTMIDDTKSEAKRQQAFQELQSQVTSALSNEKLEPRIPRVFKLTVALTSFAVAFLFPPAAIAPLLVESADALDVWLRNRNNIFEYYPLGSYGDLYVELKRLFPEIRFQAEHLAHFLQHRNFGWSDELDMIKFLYPTNK